MKPVDEARDEDFESRERRWKDHMERFMQAHSQMPDLQRRTLVELERRESWTRIMGMYAELLSPPRMGDEIVILSTPR